MEEDKNITVKVEQQEKVLFQDVCSIIEQGRQQAYANVGHIVIATYWNVGRRIVEEEQRGMKRAAYGTGLMKNLSESLIPIYGRSYSKRNLDYYKKFYLLFPDAEIVNTRVHNLEWSHVRRILSLTEISHPYLISITPFHYWFVRTAPLPLTKGRGWGWGCISLIISDITLRCNTPPLAPPLKWEGNCMARHS